MNHRADFRGEPFGFMPALLAIADQVRKFTAICPFEENGRVCGKTATLSQRLINGAPAHYNDPVVMVGGEEAYEPRCHSHHFVPGKKKKLKMRL